MPAHKNTTGRVRVRETLVGRTFGRLTVISQTDDYVKPNGRREARWACKCSCGNIKDVNGGDLKSGATKSCGCYNVDVVVKRSTKHGFARRQNRAKLYNVWKGMKTRATNKNMPGAHRYVDRGIDLCTEWYDFQAFKDWALKNGYDHDLQIDRIDNDKGYSPDNCRFVTARENQLNKNHNTETGYRLIQRLSTYCYQVSFKAPDGVRHHETRRYLEDALLYRNELLRKYNMLEMYEKYDREAI